MATKEVDKRPGGQDTPERQQLSATIGNYVMDTLGRPGDLQRMQVRHLWNDHYRVNVIVGQDIASAKVAHSYFLLTDSVGKILTSTPAITRQYS